MDIQTLVNRIDEMMLDSIKMRDIANDKEFSRGALKADFYSGEANGLLRLLLWLQANGIEADTKEVA